MEVKCDLLPLALWTVWTLIPCIDTNACCGRHTQNVIECFELGSLHSNTMKPLHLMSVRHKQHHHITMYTDLCVKLFSMNVNLRCFAFFVFVLFYAPQVKRQKIWLLFWKSHSVECFVVIIICCLGAMKIKDSRTNTLVNYIRLISEFWCAWGSKCKFWSRGIFKWWCCW